ncbi:MAG: carbon-nitrogen hydrolase family protein [Bryobacteraceae bacterium]
MRLLPALFLAAPLVAQVQLKVAAVQFRSSFDLNDNRDRIVLALEKLSREGVRVAAFPECALTGYHKDAVMKPTAAELEAAEERIRKTCRDNKIAAIVGSVYKANGKTYNTAVVFDSRGELVERYAKVYLAGEKWATPGNHIAFFELEGVPSTVIVCHDERYPELVRLPAMQGARVIYYVSSESGMTSESKLIPYRAQMMARAVENGMFVVAANTPADPANLRDSSHGQSRIIAADGNIMEEAGYFREETLTATLSIKPAKLTRPLEGPLGQWWRQGLEWMMQNRNRKLE